MVRMPSYSLLQPSLVLEATQLGSTLIEALCKVAQYMGTKEDPTNWGWDTVQEALAIKTSEIKFCLPGCQWQNGSAEQ